MNWLKAVGLLSLAGALPVTQAMARDKASAPSAKLFDDMLACRGIGETAARLACYDQRVAAIGEAQARQEVAVIDREGVRESAREQFGLPGAAAAPALAPAAAAAETDLQEIETSITSVSGLARNRWALQMADGSQWQTVEAVAYRVPKAGMAATIKKAALGTYLIRLPGWPAVRARRQK